jgi:hypothetical protein
MGETDGSTRPVVPNGRRLRRPSRLTDGLEPYCAAMAVMLPKKRSFPTLAPPARCRINSRQLPKHSTASMQGSNTSAIGKQKPHGAACGFTQCTKAACGPCSFCTNPLITWMVKLICLGHGFESLGAHEFRVLPASQCHAYRHSWK